MFFRQQKVPRQFLRHCPFAAAPPPHGCCPRYLVKQYGDLAEMPQVDTALPLGGQWLRPGAAECPQARDLSGVCAAQSGQTNPGHRGGVRALRYHRHHSADHRPRGRCRRRRARGGGLRWRRLRRQFGRGLPTVSHAKQSFALYLSRRLHYKWQKQVML